MKTQIFQNYGLQKLENVYPTIQTLDSVKLDGLVARPNIKAVWDSQHGLQFQVPLPSRLPANMSWVQKPETLVLDYTTNVLDEIARYCDIDRGDLHKEAEKYPDIAAMRINRWFVDKDSLNKGKKREANPSFTKHLVRTYLAPNPLIKGEVGVVRAIKSDRFKLGMDASDILGIVMRVLMQKQHQFEDVTVEVAVNDSKCHFTVTNWSLKKATAVGDLVCASAYGCTSDVGQSSAYIESRVVKLACTNGMRTGTTLRKAHLGGRLDENLVEFISTRTKAMQQATLLSEMSDLLMVCFDEMKLQGVVDKMSHLQSENLRHEEAKAIFDTVQSHLCLSDEAKENIFLQFLSEKKANQDLNRTKDGVIQALTATGRAKSLANYEEAIPFEELGGKLFDFDRNQWAAMINTARESSPKAAAKKFLN